MAFARTNVIASVAGCVSGLLFGTIGAYVQLIGVREQMKQVKEEQLRHEKMEKREFKARYNSEVQPKLRQVKDICARRTNTHCESPAEILEFALWFGKCRYKQVEKKSLTQKETDDTELVNDLRYLALSFYDDLRDADLKTRFGAADGGRYDFVTLVAALNQAAIQLGHQTTAYKEPYTFEYTLERISNPDKRKKAEDFRAHVRQQLQEKAMAMTNGASP